jgi:isocitrate dehydrogenase (NAD+)
MASHAVTLIPGDGIGPEVMGAARQVLDATGVGIAWEVHPLGGDDPLPSATLDSLRRTRVGLKGPVTTVRGGGPSPNVGIRRALDLYAQARPSRSWPGVPAVHHDVDLVVVRETTEDLYRGIQFAPGDADTLELLGWLRQQGIEVDDSSGLAVKPISARASRRAIAVALGLAARRRGRLTVVHKATVMRTTDGVFLETALEMARDHGDIEVDECAIDLMAARMARDPSGLDVLVMPNMYGDILSDLGAGITGGVGLTPGANIGDGIAVFEPAHGSAPRHAGMNRVDPIAAVLCGAMLLEHLGEHEAAARVVAAVGRLLAEGRTTTYDLRPPGDPGAATTTQVADALASLVSG